MRQLALALPFVLGAFGTRAAVVPLGDTIARVLVCVAPSAPKPAEPEPEVTEPEPLAEPIVAPKRIASRVPAARRREETEPAPEELVDSGPVSPRATIVIPGSAVTRALEKKDVRATNAKGPDGAPLGARLAGVGKYGVGLRDGDVVTAVQGTRTPTVEAMVQAAVGAAAGGATRLTGTIQRGEATYAVVLEIPRQ